MATFLAGRKLSRIGIDSERSSISTVLERVRCSVRSTSKSSGCKCTGVPVTPRPRRPRALHLVLADLLLGQLREEVAQGVGPDRPQTLRGQLEAPLLLLDEPRLREHPGQLSEPLQRSGGVVAEQV